MRVLVMILAAIFLLFISPSTAKIQSWNIRLDNRYLKFFEAFKFTNTGYVSVAVSNFSVISPYDVDPSRMGFFLVKSESKYLAFQFSNPNFCVLDFKLVFPFFTFQNLSSPFSPFNISYPAPYPDMFSLYFANCNPKAYVTMDVRAELYNTINNTTKIYLSLTQLPSFYFKFSLVYISLLGLWIYLCFKKQSVYKVHLIMGGFLLMTVLTLLCESVEKHFVMVTGTPHGWDNTVNMFQCLRFFLLVSMIALHSTGWSHSELFWETLAISDLYRDICIIGDGHLACKERI